MSELTPAEKAASAINNYCVSSRCGDGDPNYDQRKAVAIIQAAIDWELLEEDKPERIEITDIRQLAEVNRVEIGTAVHQKSDHKWPASKIEIFLSCLANGIKVEGWVE